MRLVHPRLDAPAEIEHLNISVKRKENARSGSLFFRIELWAQATKGAVENVRVEPYPILRGTCSGQRGSTMRPRVWFDVSKP